MPLERGAHCSTDMNKLNESTVEIETHAALARLCSEEAYIFAFFFPA